MTWLTLTDVMKKLGKTPLKDRKPTRGTNCLTDKMMNKMQCYFGQTRENTGQYSGIVQKKIKIHHVLVISFAQEVTIFGVET